MLPTAVLLLLLIRPPEIPFATVLVELVLFAVVLVSTIPGAPWPIKLADGFAPTAPSPDPSTDS